MKPTPINWYMCDGETKLTTKLNRYVKHLRRRADCDSWKSQDEYESWATQSLTHFMRDICFFAIPDREEVPSCE
jgi:hypothetical protein